MTDTTQAPERIFLQDAGDYAATAEFEVTWCVEAQDENDTEYVRADLLTAATDPDFILAALSDVHDMDATLTDYAAAVSRAIRAAMKGPTP